ncbi:TPA: hypothetical protein MI439_02145 [Klebsiella pneumoniae]|nr:hypothetical protein [Klebsiella pneumoniae]HBY6461268.1 hypothetical protein [Klebsiella pneumoniae]HBY6591050.1 hypothetical protein [Klebsiella pneumoniae]HBY6614015.1 hypothetical protein [Klebsiella pneumoniae]HBY6677287.1 hypothetical protein [Klebsiella pneumoniae]
MKNFFKRDIEHYSRRTLLWFAALVNVIGWLAILAVLWAGCSLIEGWRHEPKIHPDIRRPTVDIPR